MKTSLTPSSAIDQALQTRLRALWKMHTARLTVRGVGWLVALFCGLVTVDFFLDWQLDLAGHWRVLLLAVNLAALGWVAYRFLVRVLPRFDPVGEALRVEQLQPDLNGLLVSGVQFQDESAFGHEISRELMQAVRQQAAERAATLDLRALAQRVALRAALLAGAAGLAVLVGLALWRGDYLLVLAQRLTNPASRLAYPTLTKLEVPDGDISVRSGDSATLRARATGVIPRTGRLYVRSGALGWENIPLTAADPARLGEFVHALPRVNDTVEYYFRAGDGRSARHQVKVINPPRVDLARVQLAYPAHTRMAPQEVDSLNLKVPEGTTVTWHLKFSETVRGVDLLMEGADPLPMQLAGNGREATAQLPARASRGYQIVFKWRHGFREFTEPGAKYYLQVLPDADPQVTLLQPAEDVKATLKKVLNLAYTARDDYGLGEATLIYSVNDGAELREPLGALGNTAQADKTFAWPVTAKLSSLKIGDLLTVAVEVTDNRPGTPGKSRSLSRRVQFVSDSDYLAYILARQQKALGQLRPIYLQQTDAARELEKASGGKP